MPIKILQLCLVLVQTFEELVEFSRSSASSAIVKIAFAKTTPKVHV